MTDRAIYLEKADHIGWLVLNQPGRLNALSQAMWLAIPELVDRAEQDPGIKVVVVRGADAKAFAAGADISEFGRVHADRASSKAYNDAVHVATRRLSRCAKPLLAMVQGPCVGGGCAIALSADMRLADPTARFGIPPAKLGLVYSLEDTKLLTDLVGPSRAKDMLFTGRLVGADEAFRIGLVDRLVAADAIEAETKALAAAIAEVSQYSVRAAKQIVRQILDGASADTPDTLKTFDDAFQGEDYSEGTRAFLEKRKPRFTFS
jgi:enoyl-CoA hydratase/carnithine racemase